MRFNTISYGTARKAAQLVTPEDKINLLPDLGGKY
jgi:hypothetical protein